MAERIILFNLKRRQFFDSDNSLKTKILEHRDYIMTKLCYELQNILKNLENYESHRTKLRLSDFSNLLKNFNK
jgi:hypothetical protein